MKLEENLKDTKILPVFCPSGYAELKTFTDAISHTPLKVVEITMRNSFAPTAISEIKKELPSLLVGAGTILSEELMDKAIEAGADFLVSPGWCQSLIDKSQKLDIPFLPGCATPTEIQNALSHGFKLIKFFPAELSGGISALKLYASAFSQVSFIPTGGITLQNAASYNSMNNVVACGGSFMLPKQDLEAGNSAKITKIILDLIGGNIK